MSGRRLLGVGVLTMAVACTGRGADSGPRPMPPEQPREAPATYRVRFETSKGPFVVAVTRAWAPHGADRFHQLVTTGFFDNVRFFRVVTSFMVQFGVHGDPEVNAAWEPLSIQDDPVTQSNKRGYITFAAMSQPNSRNTQVFINLVDNVNLDGMGFAPFGQVVDGMATVDSLYAGYGESPPGGWGPDQMQLMRQGNAYLDRYFPKLDFVRTARIEP